MSGATERRRISANANFSRREASCSERGNGLRLIRRSIRSKSSNRSKRFERLKRVERLEPRLLAVSVLDQRHVIVFLLVVRNRANGFRRAR